MANLPISGLPSAGSLTGAEMFPVVQGGNTLKTTVDDLLDLVPGVVADAENYGPTTKDNTVLLVSGDELYKIDLGAIANLTSGYDISCYAKGKPDSSETVLFFVTPRSITIESGVAHCLTPANSEATFTIYRNAAPYGTVVFESGEVAGLVTLTYGSIPLSPGDFVTINAPGSQDSALEDVSISFKGRMVL